MPTNNVLRPKFFEGQYLTAADLTAAVDYGRIQEARHLLGAHTWGIAIGLHLKEVPQPGGALQVFVQPGYAWDGFARPLVVLAPYAIPADLFKSLVYDPVQDEPGGRLVAVWLRYREAATNAPADGFAVCNTADQNSRVQETFALEVGDRTLLEQESNVVVFGNSVPPAQAFEAFDSSDPLIPDGSIPHQSFPAPGDNLRWLVPLGYVRWKPNPITGQPGSFQTAAADTALSNALRVPISSITGAVQACEGVLRLKDRFKTPAAVTTNDLVWVEGNLRVDGDARLLGSKLALVDKAGQDNGVPLTLQRAGDGLGAGRQLRMEIGNAQAGQNSFQIGPTVSNNYTPVVTVLDNGKMGIGTASPGAQLEIDGGDLLLKGSAEAAGSLVFQNSSGTQKGRVWSNPSPSPALFLASGGINPNLAIDVNGSVGIGTTTPDRAVTVKGGTGTYLNIKADNGGEEVLIGADGNGAIVSAMTNHDLQLRAGVNVTRMTVKADGKVGVNTDTPARQFHVVGDRIRLENAGKTIDMRVDGSAVDLHSETSNLYLRSSGPTGNNNVIVNPFGTDGLIGVGLETPECKLHVQSNLSGNAKNANAHVALIDNPSSSSASGVLALRLQAIKPGKTNHFVTFFSGATVCGTVEGDAAGGVAWVTPGADFAECLPHQGTEETFEPGDVVGIVAGKITHRTRDAHHISVITNRAAVVGNARADQGGGRVVMIGQAVVKVRGPVTAGDLIVPSGLEDGTAIALSPGAAASRGITLVVGTAWESSNREDVKPVNTAIGLPTSMLRLQQAEIDRLRHLLPEGAER
jgi:hypothetical protein